MGSACQQSVSNLRFQPKQDPKLWTPKSPRLWQKQLTKHLRQEQWLSVSTCLGCNQAKKLTETLVGWFLNRKACAIIPYMVCDVFLKFKMIFEKANSSYTCLWMHMSSSASICFIFKLSRPQNKHRLIAKSIQESALSTSKFTPLSYEMKSFSISLVSLQRWCQPARPPRFHVNSSQSHVATSESILCHWWKPPLLNWKTLDKGIAIAKEWIVTRTE